MDPQGTDHAADGTGPDRPEIALGTTAIEALCLRCGYDLHGLSSSGLCPECGLSIAESLERRRLGLSSPTYLASLRAGAALTIGALALSIISGFARWPVLNFAFAPGTQRAFIGLDVAADLLLTAGVWMLTIDDPGLHEKDQTRPNKRAMRAAGTGLLAFALIEFLLALRIPLPVMGAATTMAVPLFTLLLFFGGTLWNFACWLILATGMVNYTRWLAVRVPDRRLLGMSETMGWLLPAAFVFALAASLFFQSATRVIPLGLMAWLVGAMRERLRSDRS